MCERNYLTNKPSETDKINDINSDRGNRHCSRGIIINRILLNEQFLCILVFKDLENGSNDFADTLEFSGPKLDLATSP